ncbi:MAG: hypothetical protein IKA63_03085 [Clostridia bacterium]|nr:hypothetical protein [Clostridia bacterium]
MKKNVWEDPQLWRLSLLNTNVVTASPDDDGNGNVYDDNTEGGDAGNIF